MGIAINLEHHIHAMITELLIMNYLISRLHYCYAFSPSNLESYIIGFSMLDILIVRMQNMH